MVPARSCQESYLWLQSPWHENWKPKQQNSEYPDIDYLWIWLEIYRYDICHCASNCQILACRIITFRFACHLKVWKGIAIHSSQVGATINGHSKTIILKESWGMTKVFLKKQDGSVFQACTCSPCGCVGFFQMAYPRAEKPNCQKRSTNESRKSA